MRNRIFILLNLALLILAFGCYEDKVISDVEITSPDAKIVDFVLVKAKGTVTDLLGNPIEDATVNWGEVNTSTDEEGHFSISGNVKEENAVFYVSKENYFQAIKTLHTPNIGTLSLEVQLIPRDFVTSFSSTQEGEVATSEGAKINFAANSFQYSDGNTYEGNVNVFAYYLDPTIENLPEVMPGNLLGINEENDTRLLQSFGMVNVELEDDQGNQLKINQSASLTVPVPEVLIDQAPSTIPLWHFDTSDGLWKEEGSATLNGNVYIGEVNHFSWWNCDVPNDLVSLNGQVKAKGSFPEVKIKLHYLSTGVSAYFPRTDDGTFYGFVIKNQPLLLEVFNVCGEFLYSQEIEGIDIDTQLPIINIDATATSWYQFSGTILNCNQELVSNGYIVVNADNINFNEILLTDETGSFSGLIPYCGGDEIELNYWVVDGENSVKSNSQSITLSSDLSLGNITACGTDLIAEMWISINGEDTFWEVSSMTSETRNNNPDVLYYTVRITHKELSSEAWYDFTTKRTQSSDPTSMSTWFVNNAGAQGIAEQIAYEFYTSNPNTMKVIKNSEIPGSIYHIVGHAELEDWIIGGVLVDDRSPFIITAITE